MGFNLGAFAGGMAKSGMDTYQLMESIESQKKRDELVALQAQEAKAALAEKEAMKEAASVYGKVGTNDYGSEMTRVAGRGAEAINTGDAEFDRAVNESAAAVALENKARVNARTQGLPTDDEATWKKAQTDAAAMKPALYTREQADADYLAKVRGINPERALDVEGKQMTVQAGRREQKFNEEFDAEKNKWNQKTADLMTRFDTALTKDGANGVIKDIGPEFKAITGKQIALVGNDIVVGTGKDAERIPAKDLRGAFESAMQHHYTNGFAESLVKKGMFKNASDAMSFWQKSQEINIAERGVAVKEAVAPSEIAKNFGAAAMYKGGGRGAGGSGAGKAAIAQQMVDDGSAPDLATAYRIMAAKGDRSSVDQDWARTRADLVKANPDITAAQLQKQKDLLYAENGFAPPALADAIQSGIDPRTGKPFPAADADKLIADFNRKYPASKVDKAELTWVKQDKTTGKSGKPDSAIPAKEERPTNFYSKEAVAARNAERQAREAAAAEEERKKREAADAQSAKMRSAIATDFNNKYGR